MPLKSKVGPLILDHSRTSPRALNVPLLYVSWKTDYMKLVLFCFIDLEWSYNVINTFTVIYRIYKNICTT